MGQPLDAMQIRQAIVRYLASETTLDDFAEWFAAASQSAIETADSSTESIVAEVRLLLAEFGRGDRTEAELQDEFRCVIREPVVVPLQSASEGVVSTQSGSSSTVAFTGSLSHVHALTA